MQSMSLVEFWVRSLSSGTIVLTSAAFGIGVTAASGILLFLIHRRTHGRDGAMERFGTYVRERIAVPCVVVVVLALGFGLVWGPVRLYNEMAKQVTDVAAGPVVVNWDDYLSADRQWQTTVRAEHGRFQLKVQLRPTSPPSNSMRLHIAFIEQDGTEHPTAVPRLVRIEGW